MSEPHHTRTVTARWWRSFMRMIVDGNEGIAGVAGIEFALLAMTLTVLAVSAMEFGMGFYRKMQVYDAAQAGAQYVIKNGFGSTTSVTSAVTSATAYSDITATPAPVQSCGCPTVSGIASAQCGTACTDGTLPATYVTVSAQATYTPMFNYPGLPATFNFTANSIVRIK